MSQARRVASYADIEALPPHVTGELIGGQLWAHPRPRDLHTQVSSRLGMALTPFDDSMHDDDGPGGWVFRDEPELHLSGDVLVPDIAAWRVERAIWPRGTAHIELAPDWVCEILSPSTESFDRAEKMPAYAHHGVKHAWLVDPEAQMLEVDELTAGVLRQRGPAYRGHVRVVAPPFEGRGIDVWRTWR